MKATPMAAAWLIAATGIALSGAKAAARPDSEVIGTPSEAIHQDIDTVKARIVASLLPKAPVPGCAERQ
jgi:hypothetical protein